MAKYRILQIDRNSKGSYYMFMRFEFAKKHGFDLSHYKEVYTGEIDCNNQEDYRTLEKLFEKFNIENPEDFHGHSLSTSDIVELDGKYYYCDSFGWKEIEQEVGE